MRTLIEETGINRNHYQLDSQHQFGQDFGSKNYFSGGIENIHDSFSQNNIFKEEPRYSYQDRINQPPSLMNFGINN